MAVAVLKCSPLPRGSRAADLQEQMVKRLTNTGRATYGRRFTRCDEDGGLQRDPHCEGSEQFNTAQVAYGLHRLQPVQTVGNRRVRRFRHRGGG